MNTNENWPSADRNCVAQLRDSQTIRKKHGKIRSCDLHARLTITRAWPMHHRSPSLKIPIYH